MPPWGAAQPDEIDALWALRGRGAAETENGIDYFFVFPSDDVRHSASTSSG